MPTYVVYDRNDGRILHTHREYLMGADESSEISEEEVLKLAGDLLPKGSDAAVTAVDEFNPRAGYRFYIDISTGNLIQVENPPENEEGQR